MSEFLLNPWVISIIIVGFVVGNLATLKYTANMKFTQVDKKKSDLDRLNDLNKLNESKRLSKKD